MFERKDVIYSILILFCIVAQCIGLIDRHLLYNYAAEDRILFQSRGEIQIQVITVHVKKGDYDAQGIEHLRNNWEKSGYEQIVSWSEMERHIPVGPKN